MEYFVKFEIQLGLTEILWFLHIEYHWWKVIILLHYIDVFIDCQDYAIIFGCEYIGVNIQPFYRQWSHFFEIEVCNRHVLPWHRLQTTPCWQRRLEHFVIHIQIPILWVIEIFTCSLRKTYMTSLHSFTWTWTSCFKMSNSPIKNNRHRHLLLPTNIVKKSTNTYPRINEKTTLNTSVLQHHDTLHDTLCITHFAWHILYDRLCMTFPILISSASTFLCLLVLV